MGHTVVEEQGIDTPQVRDCPPTSRPCRPWSPASLPNPFLTDHEHLTAWDELRPTYLGLEPDPLDRTGKGFEHA